MTNHLPPNFYIVFPYEVGEETEDLVAATNELTVKLSAFIEFIQSSHSPRINEARAARCAAAVIDALPSFISVNPALLEHLKTI